MAALGSAVYHGGNQLGSVPGLVRQVIEGQLWKSYRLPTGGEVYSHDSFVDFIGRGLGTDVETLKDFCRRDIGLLDLIDQETRGQHGGYRRPEEDANHDNIMLASEQGTSATYALSRLRKERPDIHERVLAGELSAHAGMVEAGFRARYFQAPADPRKVAEAIRRKFSSDEQQQIARWLQES